LARSEKETREQLIGPKLIQAGWEVLTVKNVIEKDKSCIETPVKGMPVTVGNTSGNGFVDYTLFGDDGKPLALIEAKKSVVNEEQGRVQACLYADCLEKLYGIRPVIYYTNGYSIRIIDGVYPSRVVFGFHKKNELEYLIQRRNKPIVDSEPNPDICNRYYQKDAIREVFKHLGNKHSRSLIVLATGTGKTRVSCAISDIFIRNNFAKRILFLADRKNLVIQAKEETFEKFLPKVPIATIIEGKVTGSKEARIIFSTYQSMLSMIKDTSTCPYGIGHFDLIIVDEAHRSLFNKYAEIFDYFDALMIGLTATPRNDIHKSTYKVFDLDNEEPNYEYDLIKAVKDGFLTYFRALDRTPDILKNGLTYEELSEEDKEQYEELFTDDDGTIPEKIEGKQFYSYITNIDTIRAVLRDLVEEGIKVNGGDVLGKTIIFARDHNHAIMIQDEFRKMYPELCNPTAVNGVDYCVVIDNKIKYNDVLQKEFKYKQDIRIVVSVDMMDTGVDIPEVVNLVFFKRIMSKTKFWQMIGRGTRLCDEANVISPSKPYFERLTNDKNRQNYQSKQGFLIFDVCNVFPFFKENPDGREDKSDAVLSLNQKIFMGKVALLKAMQINHSKLNDNEKEYENNLRKLLLQEVLSLNPNYIGVQKNLKYVEKYSKPENWNNISQQIFIEIKKHIAPNISGVIDLEAARFFDLLCYRFSATKFHKNNIFSSTAKAIYALAAYLMENKLHIAEVEAQKEMLEYIVTDEFLTKTSIVQMDHIRLNVRELMRYIENEIIEPIISDFDDKIDKTNDAEDDPVDFTVSVDDFKTFREKVEFYIRNNKTDVLVYQITNFEKTTPNAVESFSLEVTKLAKDEDEYKGLFENDTNIPTFVRKTAGINQEAINVFIDFESNKGYNERQLNYIKELLKYISQNGKFERKDLLREELYFGDLFDSVAINSVIADVESKL
jgi:type I restriction enzyme R subunit